MNERRRVVDEIADHIEALGKEPARRGLPGMRGDGPLGCAMIAAFCVLCLALAYLIATIDWRAVLQ